LELPLEQDGPDAQHVDGLRKEIMRRGAVAAPPKRLQFLDRQRVADGRKIDAEVKTGQSIRFLLNRGRAQTISRISSSVRPTSGPRSNAPKKTSSKDHMMMAISKLVDLGVKSS
jgi:hypothetical protein